MASINQSAPSPSPQGGTPSYPTPPTRYTPPPEVQLEIARIITVLVDVREQMPPEAQSRLNEVIRNLTIISPSSAPTQPSFWDRITNLFSSKHPRADSSTETSAPKKTKTGE